MIIQFNTDKNIHGSEEFTAPYVAQIEGELSRYSHQITRVEVHLSDEDGNKNGVQAMRCMIEARVEGRQPIAVTNQTDTYDQAVSGALDKLTAALDTLFGRMRSH
ncbi:MAG: HPF/RaiA family ribosome-associated protein [Bacteroidia bacterium]|nr:HPF/RaiA family ribosome-associated protein [Bacteroidia bacterium]